jgi:toxin secretion/phage lysis holin
MNSAKSIYYTVLAGIAAIGGVASQYLGGWDQLTQLLAWAMAIDYLTGALCAAVWHKSPKTPTGGYESRAGFKGLIRKGVIVLIVMIAAELDKLAGTTAMRTATILFFAANDGMSILENLGIMGVPYPPALKNAFEVLRRKSEDKGDGDDKDGGTPQMSTVDTPAETEEDEYKPQHELPGDPYAELKEDMDYKDVSGLLDEEDE